MFFAGPCTGGSSWASLNRSKGPETEAIVEAKVRIFEQLWGRFETLFVAYYDKQIGVYMELPRGCQYWDNEDVKFMIEGTESTTHDFDGCCYGLRQKFGDMNKYIKKPWRIVSWNVDVGSKLSLKCDGRHEHAPEGRHYTHKYTQARSCQSFWKNNIGGAQILSIQSSFHVPLVQADLGTRRAELHHLVLVYQNPHVGSMELQSNRRW